MDSACVQRTGAKAVGLRREYPLTSWCALQSDDVRQPMYDDLERFMTDRLRFLIGLCLVALGASLFAITFRSSLAFVYRAAYGSENVVAAITGLSPWMRLVVPAVGGFVAGLVVWLRAAPAQGVSNVMEAVALGNVRLSLRTTLTRVMASWTAIAAGMSIGREGPLIEFGGTLGATMGRVMRTSLDQTRVLVAAGTAAGFAAAYNTPFAACCSCSRRSSASRRSRRSCPRWPRRSWPQL